MNGQYKHGIFCYYYVFKWLLTFAHILSFTNFWENTHAKKLCKSQTMNCDCKIPHPLSKLKLENSLAANMSVSVMLNILIAKNVTVALEWLVHFLLRGRVVWTSVGETKPLIPTAHLAARALRK
jgi:hypothetical protein